MEPTTGIEPVTSPLPRVRSTTELRRLKDNMVGREGFEPSKAKPTDLQSAPFVHLGTSPYFGAGDPTRTDDLLITNQLLSQLSYTGKPKAFPLPGYA